MGGQGHAPAVVLPGKREEAGWDPGPVWTVQANLAPPSGFDPWIVQPVAPCRDRVV